MSEFTSGLPIDSRYFPFGGKIQEMRPEQIEAARKISEAIGSGETKLVICGPPGVGKSAIGIMVAKYLESIGMYTTYTSPLNTLVDQLDASFPDVCTLKGRDHYLCEVGKRTGQPLKCSNGLCKAGLCATRMLEAKTLWVGSNVMTPAKRDCRICTLKNCICQACEFVKAKEEYKEAKIGNTNFTMFRFGMRYSDCVLIDECEMTEGFLRMELGITVKEKWEPVATWGKYLERIQDLVVRKVRTLSGMTDRLAALRNSDNPIVMGEYADLTDEVEKVKNEIHRLQFITRDYDQNKEPWVSIPEVYKDQKGIEHYSIRFEPTTVDRFISKMFTDGQLVIFMSATPIIPDGWHFIELPSPFPVSIRPWVYDPVGKMTFEERGRTIPKLANYIIKLQKKRPGKLLVHCVSYKIARDIADCLYASGITHITLQNQHDDIEGMAGLDAVTRSRALSNFISAGNTNQIFLSVNMESGIDLWQSEFRTQIIAKVPFQNPTDPVTIAKKQYLRDATKQLNQEVANKIVQGYGRINRNDQKETLTIITDGSFANFYSQNRRLFRKYFTEAEIKKNRSGL